MRDVARTTLLGLALAIQLLATGCLGLGGGSGSSGGSGSGTDGFASLTSGGSGSGGNGFGGPVHSPEPASVALFGGGLVGLGMWRRRKAQRKS